MLMTLICTFGLAAAIAWAAAQGSPRQVSAPSDTTTMIPGRLLEMMRPARSTDSPSGVPFLGCIPFTRPFSTPRWGGL